MYLLEIIKEYQVLVGILSPIALWYLKELYDKRKELKNNKKEIENIFFMMARDSEESVKDIIAYIQLVRESLKSNKDEINVFQHSKFNRIYINEERLFTLKKDIGFVLSQQIDIAISSAKKFNSYMESIETEPVLLFDVTVKTIESSIETKEKALAGYERDLNSFLNRLTFMTENDIRKAQINILRPVVALSPKYKKFSKRKTSPLMDQVLNDEAEIILEGLKFDLE